MALGWLCTSTQPEELAKPAGQPTQLHPELSAGVSSCTLDVQTHTHAYSDTHTHTYWQWQGCLSSGQEESVMCCGLLSRREDPDAERRRLLLWHTKGREVINDHYRSGRKLQSLFSPTQVGSWSEFLSTWPRNNWVTVVAQQPQQPLQMYWGQSVQTGSKYQLIALFKMMKHTLANICLSAKNDV